MDRSYWGDLERGERTASLASLWLLAEGLKIPLSRLAVAVEKHFDEIRNHQVTAPRPRLLPKHLRKFMDASQEMKWFIDRDLNNVYCNRLLLDYMGVSLEETLGNNWTSSIHPEDLPKLLEHRKKGYARREAWITRYRIRRSDGKFAWIQQEAVPQSTKKGIFIGYLGTMNVVRERDVS